MNSGNTYRLLLAQVISLLLGGFATAGTLQWEGPKPSVSEELRRIAEGFSKYSVVLEPDRDEPEWWAGAPSVVRDDQGIFWLAARMRSPEFPRGLRGYEIRILKSRDGVRFTKVHSILKEQVPTQGFERPSLLIDPMTKDYKLYACGPWGNGPWSIIKFKDAGEPTGFDPSSARPVIQPPPRRYPRDVSVNAYKDPFILFAQGRFHCFVTGYIRRNERTFHFVSDDGENWTPVGDVNEPVLDLAGWHNFFTRPSSVLPLGIGYLFVYEGSSTQWYDPVYNIATGLGFTFDLNHVIDLTSVSPLAISSTPGDFHTLRYSDWIWVDGEIWIYAEAARKNNSHEIRLFRIKME